jgi:hypothetical protein
MGRRAALVALVLVIVLVIAGTVALSNGRDTLDHQRTTAETRWKPLRVPLTDRYTKLAAVAAAAKPLGDRRVLTQIDAAETRWAALMKQPFQPDQVPAEVTAAWSAGWRPRCRTHPGSTATPASPRPSRRSRPPSPLPRWSPPSTAR